MTVARINAALGVSLRHMEPRDLPQVLGIIERTPAPRWARQDILFHFNSDDISSWVALQDDQVAGFVVCRVFAAKTLTLATAAEPQRSWRTDNASECKFELLHLAVAPESHRNGIGRALVQRFVDRLSQAGDSIRATVPESNLPVQLFLRSLDFKAVRVLRGYYGEEDAYVMERRVD